MQTYTVVEHITKKIYFIRVHKVMIDVDLAQLYDVEPSHLNRAVNRNPGHFPSDFMFQLSRKEYEFLRCQIGISYKGRGGRRYLPYVFTEQGVAMLSSVLKSNRAVKVNVAIMRAFVKLRETLTTSEELLRKLNTVEKNVEKNSKGIKKHSREIKLIFDAIRALMAPKEKTMGFQPRFPLP